MMSNKSVPSALSLLMVVVVVALMGMSPARQAWQINAWSLQYTRHTFNPLAAQSAALPGPPAGHARAKFWLAKAALHLRGNPALAETLISSQAAQDDPHRPRMDKI